MMMMTTKKTKLQDKAQKNLYPAGPGFYGKTLKRKLRICDPYP